MLGSTLRIYFTLGIMSSMNFCAPNPGSTVMTNILSMSPYLLSSTKVYGRGVPGLILTPAAILCYLIFVSKLFNPEYVAS